MYSIREAATVNLRKLAELFGPAWATATIVPKVYPPMPESGGEDPAHLQRNIQPPDACRANVGALDVHAPQLPLSDDHAFCRVGTRNFLCPNISERCRCSRAATTLLLGPSAAQELSDVVGAPAIVNNILPVTLSLVNDPIPNIRFNVAKALERMIPSLAPTHKAVLDQQVKPALERLAADQDPDVRFFAAQALHRTAPFRLITDL